MPYPCSHLYFDIKFGDRLYSKEKRRAWPNWYQSKSDYMDRARVVLTKFISVCRMVWYWIWGILCLFKSETENVIKERKSAICPNRCCRHFITVESTPPSSMLTPHRKMRKFKAIKTQAWHSWIHQTMMVVVDFLSTHTTIEVRGGVSEQCVHHWSPGEDLSNVVKMVTRLDIKDVIYCYIAKELGVGFRK